MLIKRHNKKDSLHKKPKLCVQTPLAMHTKTQDRVQRQWCLHSNIENGVNIKIYIKDKGDKGVALHSRIYIIHLHILWYLPDPSYTYNLVDL
mgnify:CR=1 FL=1